MKTYRAAQTCAVIAVFSACGRLDLGSYGDVAPAASVGAADGEPADGAGAAAESSGGSPGYVDDAPLPDHGGQSSLAGEPMERGEGGLAGEPGERGGSAGETGGMAGAPTDLPSSGPKPRSCGSLPSICGLNQQSCCAVERVPTGDFVRGRLSDSEAVAERSHVSGFYLGTFEVTVGRFHAFLDDYDAWRASGALDTEAGRHPLISGTGWNPAWSRAPGDPPERRGLGVDRAEVEGEVTRCLEIPFSNAMWLQPVNCVTFYEAQAFCIWDGGRLPTDLEWEYAAAGGDQNRVYPWGMAEPTHALAMYGCSSDVGSPCLIPSVGSYPAGATRFGQLDMAGSLSEWTFDTVGEPVPNPCNDCAVVEQIYDVNPRDTRGGNWTSDDTELKATSARVMESHLHLPMYGFRCAYDVPDDAHATD